MALMKSQNFVEVRQYSSLNTFFFIIIQVNFEKCDLIFIANQDSNHSQP
jgi:hypothetical protein